MYCTLLVMCCTFDPQLRNDVLELFRISDELASGHVLWGEGAKSDV